MSEELTTLVQILELYGKGIGTLGRGSPAQLNIVLKAVKGEDP